MKISLKTGLIILSGLIITISAIWFLPAEDPAREETNYNKVNYEKLDDVIFNVETKKITRSDFVQSINASGIAKAARELSVTSNLSGVISKINIYEGKKVKKDERLVKLDDREYNIALNDAEVKVTDARVEYGFLIRGATVDSSSVENAKAIEEQIAVLKKGYESGKISEKDYNSQKEDLDLKLLFTGAKREELILNKSGLTSAINQYKRAKLNLEYTSIRAPFAGIIGNVELTVGRRINSGTELFKLFDLRTVKIEIGILESEIHKVKIGNLAEVKLPSLIGEKFKGKVERVSPFIDPETKTCKIIVTVENAEGKIKSGMTAEVKIETNVLHNQILIPKEALLVRDNRSLVFIVENDLAKWKYVDVGEQNDEYYQILKGVEPDEDVIVKGHFTLAHDAKVKVVNDK